jgi:hypothetical protein
MERLPPNRIEQQSIVSRERAALFESVVEKVNKKAPDHARLQVNITRPHEVKPGDVRVLIVGTRETERKAFWKAVNAKPRRRNNPR